MSALPPLRGHHDLRASLAAAARNRELPDALLFLGPQGIGKQRLALWLAQYLLCEKPAGNEPCNQCQPCRFALRLEHPDIHWFFPLPRPKVSGGADRLGEALEEARAAELEARRQDPWYASVQTELVGIYLAHAHVIRRLAASRPAMARHKVFVIGDAEALVPQEASPEAANALLKLFEEPPPDTTIIVTAADPDALLPTIRSRLRPVRVRPLPLEEVAAFLEEVRGLTPAEAGRLAHLAGGSIGRALGFLPTDGEPGPLEAARQRARELLAAALEGKTGRLAELALAQPPAGARGDYAMLLDFLIVWLRDLAAAAAGADDAILNTDAAAWLRKAAARLPAADAAAQAIRDAEEALGLVQFNINPQLGMSALLRSLASRLAPLAA